ncbi:MAG: GNAT family N-acetyltransferase [Acidimicrobiales bacterium]
MTEIRAVRPAEYEPLAVLTVTAYRALDGGGDLGSYADELADVATRAAVADVLVAVDDGLLLGGVTFVPGPDNAYAEELREGEVGIRMLAVAPDVQGRGIGRALSVACIERARSVGAVRVALHSTPWMGTAHRLYESLGFVRTPERDLRVSPELVLMSFVLSLGPPR